MMKYAIAGKGRSGKAAYEFLKTQGDEPEYLEDVEETLTPEKILAFDAVVLSPGIPRTHPAILAALKAQKPVYNEIDVAVPHVENCRFIGITGTNGKSTTTALLGHIVSLWEPNTFVGGNLGRPFCEALTAGERPKYAILELSSFQLETLSHLKLHVAVLLNLTPDHLDRYPSVEAYYATKQRIFDLLIAGGVHIELPSFELPSGFEMSPKLLGRHNIQNVRAAILAAQACQVPDTIIRHGLETFPGIAHRLEILGQKNGVTWINDSKATTVESTQAALECFGSGVHLILGGKGKGVSYEALVQLAQGRVREVYVIGEDAPVIARAFAEHDVTVLEAETLQTAVRLASANAKPGETVLLSPACASYDQFDNFEHRGEVFRSLFHAL